MEKLKFIAHYLPQFHPIPENDEWWGKGFTEWTNVTKAKPLFKGHYQPQLPADLGFYDLRSIDTRNEQAALARKYSIEGFAYYHYWLNGKRLLERPLDEVLESGEPDFPFCLIWANETWSRRWLGEEKEILIKQTYSAEDDIAHARYLVKVFTDKRYICHGERPLFTIYRPHDLPDVSATLNTIKEISLKEIGIEPFILANNSHAPGSEELIKKGFDAIFSFRPQLGVLSNSFDDGFLERRLIKNVIKHNVLSGTYKIYDYKEALGLMESLEPDTFDNIIPSVFVGWDNTARRGEHGIIIKDNFPALFEMELIRVKKKLMKSDNNLGFLFINSWNEWAEGNHLEPDNINRHAYLQAVKNVMGTI
jgi:hypothetical protein